MWTVLASVCNQKLSWETFFGSTPRLSAPSCCLCPWSDLLHFTQSQSINHMEIYVRILSIGRQWARGAYIVEREKLLDKILILIDAMQIISSGVCVFVQPPHSSAINLFYFYCCSSSRTFCWLEVSQVIADGFISSSYNIFLKFITIVNRHCHCHCELWLIVSSFRLTQKSETHQLALKPQRISLLI